MINKFGLKQSRRCCSLDKSKVPIFFSLIDYRNNYFTSDDLNKIIEFYNGFNNCDQLIQWMRERPTGKATIHEVEGNKDNIVVIPTADFDGKYSRECRNNIFKGLHMVFVESAEIPDPYFNGAHNVNVGIRKAMEYNPKWIIYSGDDMVKEDEISVLVEGLKKVNPNDTGLVFCSPGGEYYSRVSYVSTPRKIRYFINPLLPFLQRKSFEIHKKFRTKYFLSGTTPFSSLLYSRAFKYKDTIAFGIYSAEMIKEFISKDGYLFDETFINCCEESDLAIRIQKSKWKVGEVKFRIEPLIGSSLGRTFSRYVRDQVGVIYMSSKIENLSMQEDNLD